METQTIIPLFESNQILSSTHLNQLREYLEDEIRYSRTMLTGVGIVTGLSLKSFDGSSIVITPGYGITTDGYLLDMPCALGGADEEIIYTRFQPYYDPMLPEYNFGNSATDSNWDESGASAKNTQAKLFRKNPLPDPVMFELFTDTVTKYDKNAFDIKDFDSKTKFKLDDMAVILFGEFDDQDLKNCTGTNCDNKGKKRVVDMRMLLVPYTKLNEYSAGSILTRNDVLEFLNIPRLQKTELLGIDSLSKLTTAYTTIINSHATQLHNSIDDAFKKYSYLLALTKDQAVTDALAKLSPATILKDQKYIQYTLDLLGDVTQTFNEFADEAYLFLRSCKITFKPFPRHLTIGRLKPATTKYYDTYRTVFFNMPPFDAQDHHLDKARTLFRKMLGLTLSFKASSAAGTIEDIKITPDGTQQELFTERSVPYYYDNTKVKDLIKLWNPEKTLRGREKERYGYYASDYTAPQLFVSPFTHSLNQLPMLRVEGIAGLNALDAKTQLEKLKLKHNLGFEVKLLRLEDAADVLDTGYDCEYDDLQADYLQVREEITCCIKEIQAITDLEDSLLDPGMITEFLKLVPDFDLADFEAKTKNAFATNNVSKRHLAFFALATIGKNTQAISNFLQLAGKVSGMHTITSPAAGKIFKALPYNLKDFKYDDFILSFKSFIYLAVQYRTYFEIIVDAIEYFFSDIEMKTSMEKQLETYRGIAVRLRALDCSCSYPKLGILEELRTLRQQRKKDAGVFRTYLEYVKTGLEHYAAVPRDGTIYLVYTNQPAYNGNTKNQVVADFSVNGSCCGISCGPDPEQGTDQPIISYTDEEVTTLKELVVKGKLVIDILDNDYFLDDPSKQLSDVEINEISSPDSYKNTGQVIIDKSTKNQKAVYTNTAKEPTIDFFLFEIVYTVTHTNPYTNITTKTKSRDYSTLRVIVKGNAIRLINTKPDRAATMIGKKVKIDLLANDNSDIARKDRVVSLAHASGGPVSTKPYLSDLGNVVTLENDKQGLLCIANFDSSNTSKKITDTVTDRFYYIVSDTDGDTSLTTFVDVDILPCCNRALVFKLPRLIFCKNDIPVAFTVEVPDDVTSFKVTGPGVSNTNPANPDAGTWMFDPRSPEVKTTDLTFSLINKTTKETLGTLLAKVHPLADFTGFAYRYVTEGFNYLYFGATAQLTDAAYVEWYTGSRLLSTETSFTWIETDQPLVTKVNLRLKAYHEIPSVNPDCFIEVYHDFDVILLNTGSNKVAAYTLQRYSDNIANAEKFTAATASTPELSVDTIKLSNERAKVLLDKTELAKLKPAAKEKLLKDSSAVLSKLNTAAGSLVNPAPETKTAVYDVYKTNTFDTLSLIVADTGTGSLSSTTQKTLEDISNHLTEINKAGQLNNTDIEQLDQLILDAKNNTALKQKLTDIRSKF
jgi:hypothetical protein